MKFGLSMPNFGPLANVRLLAELAREAESAGWDGVFLWDHVSFYPAPHVDPWVALTAIALATTRVRIGALVTPLPRRRPVKFARETVSVDQVSGGRLIAGVGSGGGPWEFDHMGDEPNPRTRGEMLDEALDLVVHLWSGEPVMHNGTHYRFQGDGGPGDPRPRPTPLLPRPVQAPRIPLWLAGSWPNKRPFIRAARWDGVVPMKVGDGMDIPPLTPADVRDIAAFIRERRTNDSVFDITTSGRTSGVAAADDRAIVAPFSEAGATWWIEDIHPWAFGWDWKGNWPIEDMLARARRPPPSG